MNVKLPILALLLGAIVFWLLGDGLKDRDPKVADRSGKLGGSRVTIDRAIGDDQAQQILQRSIRRLTSYESLSAEIRVEINLYEQQLVGSGIYRQVGPVSDQLLRLDLNIGTGDSLTRLQQVNTGRYLWIKKDFPSINHPGERDRSVSRIDLRTVREAMLPHGAQRNLGATRPEMISMGGISQLLRELGQHFEFESSARSDSLRGHPVWLVRGLRRREPDAEAASHDTTASLPNTVILWLGQTDGLPYRVQYFGDTSSHGGQASAPRRLASLDILAAQFGQFIDPRHFSFKQNDFNDVTMRYIERLSLAKQPVQDRR